MNAFDDILIDLVESTEPCRNQEDYIGDNGLLYCGKCNTTKQVEVNICGAIRKPYCMCKCEEEAYAKEKANSRTVMSKQEIDRNRASGFLDIETANCTFAKDDKSNINLSNIAKRYVVNFDKMKSKGKGLIFLGNAGTGKTFLAACIVNALIDRGYKCLMTNFPRVINELSSLRSGKQEYIDCLNNYDLLVIDDMSIERDTEYTAEIIQNVIDSRYRSGKPLIVTTNLTREDFERPKDVRKERLYSRLYEMCLPIMVTGNDRRKANAAIKDNELKSMLGIK